MRRWDARPAASQKAGAVEEVGNEAIQHPSLRALPDQKAGASENPGYARRSSSGIVVTVPEPVSETAGETPTPQIRCSRACC